MNYRSC